MDHHELTNQEILDTLLASFSDIEAKMSTKEDLGKMEHRILDGVDRKLTDLKGDLVVLMREEDNKVVELINVLHKKNILNETESKQLLKLRPFPQLVI